MPMCVLPLSVISYSFSASGSEKDVLRYLARRLPHWKRPLEMRFLDELPMTSSGKIQKHILKEWVSPDSGEPAPVPRKT